MKKYSRMAVMTGSVVAIFMAAGCATTEIRHAYKGAPREPAELATIIGTTNSTYSMFNPAVDRISFSAVDDRDTTPWYSWSPLPTEIYVLPGRHKVDVEYAYIHGLARGPIWVDAQSNHIYRVKVMNPESRTTRVYFLIEDITSQSLVGGANTPEP